MAALNGICWKKYDALQTIPEFISRFMTGARHGSIFQDPQWYLRTEEKTDQYMVLAALRQGQPVFASLIRKSWLPGTGSFVSTVPRGPIFDDIHLAMDIWEDYEAQLVENGICAIEIHPFWERFQAQKLTRYLQKRGYVHSTKNMSHTETLTLDLTPSEEALFYNLKSNRRNLIRKAIKIGIEVKPVQTSKEMALFWDMYHDICLQKGLKSWSRQRFEHIWRFSIDFPTQCICLLGWLNGELVGGNIILRHSHVVEVARGGGSTKIRNTIPKTDLILWESILWAKQVGATSYDLGGITPNAEKGSPEWGINCFKSGFSDHRVLLFKPMEKIFHANHYNVHSALKKVKHTIIKTVPAVASLFSLKDGAV